MIKMLGKIPDNIILACSGGVDSMFALDFLSRGRRNITVLNLNHGTSYGKEANAFVKEYASKNKYRFLSDDIGNATPAKGQSLEAFWHDFRYNAYREISDTLGLPIVVCHHLDDQVEQWIMTSAKGNPGLISYSNKRTGVIRPFLLTRKQEMYYWCERNCVPFLEDPSNEEVEYTRNLVRHEVVPLMLRVNPGLHKVIAKKVILEYDNLDAA